MILLEWTGVKKVQVIILKWAGMKKVSTDDIIVMKKVQIIL